MSKLHEVHPGASKQVIFIHGVDGSWKNTWTSPDPVPPLFWPERLGQDTGWQTSSLEYDAATWLGHTMPLNERAKNLLELIEIAEPDPPRDLCLVTHSFGGIVAKRMVLLAQQEARWKKFLDRLTGLTFLGTPHLGSKMANLLSHLPGATATTDEIKIGTETLRTLNESFRALQPAMGLQVLALAESKRYKVGPFRTAVVVEPFSADAALFGVPVISVDCDHHELACPKSVEDEQYKMVFRFLSDCFSLPAYLAKLPRQAGAACYRRKGESIEFLLVLTDAGRWTFPKGKIEDGESASRAAAREAREEAGAVGTVSPEALGAYLHLKSGYKHAGEEKAIQLFPLEVLSQVPPEDPRRTPTWFTPQEARERLAEKRKPQYASEVQRMIDLAVVKLAPKGD